MKKIFFITLFCIQASVSIAQEQESRQTLTQEDYLRKSKKQKQAARISMATGVGLLGISLVAIAVIPPTSGEDDKSSGTLITGLGLAGIATGIYLHSASKKNKRRAAQTSVFLDVKKNSHLSQAGIRSGSYPAVGLKIIL